MSDLLEASVLAAKLPGTWSVVATNFPMWLDGTRHNPEFTYETVNGAELTFSDTVSFTTSDGEPKTIVGTDRLRGVEFVWRGRGWRALLTSRWRVVGASDEFDIVVIHFSRSRLSPAGIDVLVRTGAEAHAVRSAVAHAAERFGLSAEEFASLTWLH